jgi:3-hydroxyisobutyrate dehydrogenase
MQNDSRTTIRAEQGQPSVAVIGTGTMGSAIARRLLGLGTSVSVWNRSPQPALALAELGATAYADPGEAVAGATVVLTLLPTEEIVTDLMIGRRTVDAMAPQAVWAQMGTVGVEAVEHLDAAVHARRPEVAFVDAPVSGSRHPAESGELLVLASGPEEAAATVAPVFDAIGRRTLWLGPAGAGTRMKLVLNTWLAFEVEAAAEGAALAARFGIAPQMLATALEGNPSASPLATAKLAKFQSGDFRADFALEWELKDLDLMRQSAGAGAAPVALAIAERWRKLVEEGFGGLDVSVAGLGLGDGQPVGPGASRGMALAATSGTETNGAVDA